MSSPTSPSSSVPSKRAEEEDADSPEEEEEEEEEEEPQLNYERIGGDIAKVIRGDLVSAFCVGSKFLVCHLILAQGLIRLGGRVA